MASRTGMFQAVSVVWESVKAVFIHQNMPGQYKHLAAALAADPANQVVFITKRGDRPLPNVRRMIYATRKTDAKPHLYLRSTQEAVYHGQEVAKMLLTLKNGGFVPDVIAGHPGWGETLFVKDVFPRTPYLNYCEYYYRPEGQDFGFDPSFAPSLDSRLALRLRATPLLHALEACDRGIAPTHWQRSTHPPAFQPKIAVIHEGIDTRRLQPDPAAAVPLPDGRVLRPGDEVVTYVARNLEPYRGFPTFMRAVPAICAARPGATVLVVGGDEVSYGSPPKDAKTWREAMLKEVEADTSRVHFLGHLPYEQYMAVLSVSTVHVYLTYPFVLSWSMLESMAMGCAIVASDTAPVREVIRDGENGLLTPFFDPAALAARVVDVLADPRAFDAIRSAARKTAQDGYELQSCLQQNIGLLHRMVEEGAR
ncbi:glycosyltransferase involved in cell wall biosynthesis [Azospirillum fermentarium]|uniref:glycosyltransferase family 4 protein n=1 Tax=Azospirillum fermentarium TaxID=1233114 RepID=UPI002227C31A|nr:glycosyltransferase family 4 protein [Azospirillum fermentarium]MCW2247045.1 glycosyltransferase involved in cell wall biosynthesis [Azospirillum fermentarium]